METLNQADLDCFEGFLKSIESASAVSEPAAKMHKLFNLLYNIAARYIELQSQASAVQTEMQLVALGLPRARTFTAPQLQKGSFESQGDTQTEHLQESHILATNDHEFQWAVNPIFWTGNGAELENWFYENQSPIETLQNMDIGSTSG